MLPINNWTYLMVLKDRDAGLKDRDAGLKNRDAGLKHIFATQQSK